MLPLALTILALAAQPQDEFLWRLDRPVDPGFADTGGLVESFRIPMTDLRVGDGWDSVYEMESSFGPLYARRNGGLTAVFPQSNYVAGRDGTVPVVPPNTVYVIGEPAPWLLEQLGLDDGLAELDPPGRLDRSLPPAPLGSVSTPPPASSTALTALEEARRAVSMWYNESVRERRISELLSEAAAAGDD